jgi:hypothetical protein
MSAIIAVTPENQQRINALRQYRRKLNEHRELDEKLKQCKLYFSLFVYFFLTNIDHI